MGCVPEVAYLNDGDVFLLTKDGITSSDSGHIPDFELLEGTYEEQNPGRFEHDDEGDLRSANFTIKRDERENFCRRNEHRVRRLYNVEKGNIVTR